MGYMYGKIRWINFTINLPRYTDGKTFNRTVKKQPIRLKNQCLKQCINIYTLPCFINEINF